MDDKDEGAQDGAPGGTRTNRERIKCGAAGQGITESYKGLRV